MGVGEIVEERGRRLLHVREVKAIDQCLRLRPEHEHMLCGQLPANVLAQAVRTLTQLRVACWFPGSSPETSLDTSSVSSRADLERC